MPIEETIAKMITPVLDALEFNLVRVAFASDTLQIMAEPIDANRTMTVDDCAMISKRISAVLDAEDPIRSQFTLEVSSPGLARPLTHQDDYRRFKGSLAKITLKALYDGRRRFKGRLQGLGEAGAVLIDTAFGQQSLPFDAIESARLDPSGWFIKPFKPKRKG